MQFKLVNDATGIYSINLNYNNKNKRYIAPEIKNIEGYCKKYSVDQKEFSFNVSDA